MSDLPRWPRPHFAPGGGDAFLFFAVVGAFSDIRPAFSRSVYRSEGPPSSITVSKLTSSAQPDRLAGLRDGLPWQWFCEADPEASTAVEAAPEAIVLRGDVPDPSDLNYLRDTVGLATYLLDHGGVAIYDPQILHWWTPADWREQVFTPASAVPRRHVVILRSGGESGGGTWFHTRGLRKFGRPDLSVRNVPDTHHEPVIDLLNRFIEMQAHGAIIPEGQRIKMATLPPGLVCRHGGHLEDPDYNNVHVEMAWPE